MGKEKTEQDEARAQEFKRKRRLKELKDLEVDELETISIEAETELATRESIERGALVHISEIKDKIKEASREWGLVGGLSTGLFSLDKRIGGLRKGDIIMIAGNPGGGKSALAGNIAVNVAKEYPVLFISLEMLPERIGVRFKHYNGGSIDGLDIHFQKESKIDYRHLRPLFENAVEKGAKLVVLDYFQYLGRGMDVSEVAKMSVEMKKLAQEFELPFIIILSLRKGGTQFKRKWVDVELEDLMGTSAIGYDADAVILASRADPKGKFDEHYQWLKIIKVRDMPNDPSEFIKLKWDKTRITEPKEEYVEKPSPKVEEITQEEFDSIVKKHNRIDKA